MSSMILEIDGQPLDIFTSKSVQKSIEQASGFFRFTATSNRVTNFPIKRLASVRVLIEGEPVLTGFVDSINVSYDGSSHNIEIIGRDKTSILIDSSVVGNRTFNSPISLQQIVEKVISQLRADIDVVDEVGTLTSFTNEVAAEVGQSAFDFIEGYCKKRQVLLTTNGDGDVVLTRASTSTILTKLLNQKGNFENNILSSSITYDDSQRYRSYTVYGQAVGSDSTTNANQTNQKGIATDPNALATKQLVLQMEHATDIETSTRRAEWEANIRRARSFRYNCTVQDFFHRDGLWSINTLVNVIDDYADINSDMLIKDIEYIETSDGGTLTSIELITPDAYTLQAERTAKDELINNQGDGFI